MMEAVVAENLVKKYLNGKETIEAVKNVSFSVSSGELFGFIGPDGAGKTSLFRMLVSLLLPDAGRASVAGFDSVNDYREIRKRVGYMPGRFSLYQDLTVAENLGFFASIFNTTLQENYELIKDIYVQLEPFKDRRAGKLSGGMKQKLALCCALIHKPSVLFLDEPTTGVDAVFRKEFWDMLKQLKTQGITILVSTPYMDEAALCDRVALMQAGELLSIDTPEGIINSFGRPLIAIRADNMFHLLNQLQASLKVADAYAFGEYHHIILQQDISDAELRTLVNPEEFPGLEMKPVQANIEDCFIALMK
ncbi:MAG TPA: ABC transporter ATP-binding protein [Sphingobacteriaceae bacterium]